MSALMWEGTAPRPYSKTDFGTYRCGFFTFPIYADYAASFETNYVTVYWTYLDRQQLYIGFDVNEAFDAAENDYAQKLSGSLHKEAA